MFKCLCSYFHVYVIMCENKDDDDENVVNVALLLLAFPVAGVF